MNNPYSKFITNRIRSKNAICYVSNYEVYLIVSNFPPKKKKESVPHCCSRTFNSITNIGYSKNSNAYIPTRNKHCQGKQCTVVNNDFFFVFYQGTTKSGVQDEHGSRFAGVDSAGSSPLRLQRQLWRNVVL